MAKKIETLANVAIILVACVLCFVVIHRYYFSAPNQVKSVELGSKLVAPGVDWAAAERTLVVAISTTCHYCSESAGFYQRLAAQSKQAKNVHLMAVLPQGTAEAREHLTKEGVEIADVRQMPLAQIHVLGTPTLILVDRAGTVKSVWVGKLPHNTEDEVVKAVFPDGG